MQIRIRIQQLKLMRIHADPDTDPDPKPCLNLKRFRANVELSLNCPIAVSSLQTKQNRTVQIVFFI